MATSKIYDDDQLKAINASDGYFLVLAPPGCGKTDILAERIARANAGGVDFDQMLCLTFTNRASRGMTHRISQRLGIPTPSLFVGNVHRYCSKYIFENHVVPENTSILDDDDQADLFISFEPKYFQNGVGQINKNAVQKVARLASYITQSRLGHPESVKFTDTDFDVFYDIARKSDFDPRNVDPLHEAVIYALQYINYKEDKGIIDFEDILILAYDHMINNDHARYSWIQVDEVQDLNSLQLGIVDFLTGDRHTVMYLGDEQQAIFSFMGAKLGLLNILKQRCQGNILTLGNNYRSPEYLLNVCNEYAVNELNVDPEILPKPVNKTTKEKFDLILTESLNVEVESRRILKMVQYYLSLSTDERLAILVTKNSEADKISDTLNAAGIPNFKISGTDMFKTRSFKTLSSFYSVLVNDFNFVAWSRLLWGIAATRSLVSARNLVTELKRRMMTPTDLLTDDTYLSRFIKRYATDEFVFFDTETTGLNVLEDDIVQIAAFKVKNGQKVPGSDFDIILETDREIPPMLGDIVNPLVERYTQQKHFSRSEGLKLFIEYVGNSPLLGHNVNYDYQILKNNVKRSLGTDIDYDIFDSLHIIKCVEPNLRRYKLEFLLKELNLEGKNSHLANEDIEATKSLIDYCVERALPVLESQVEFLSDKRVINTIKRMAVLKPLFDKLRSYMYLPVAQTKHTIVDELRSMHAHLRADNIIESLEPKFEIFLRFIQNEWLGEEVNESLYDQISNHITEITSSINEGDLVNSQHLLTDRVFIMTVYKGKGLEFENVVVLSANEGSYPFYMVDKILKSRLSTPQQRKEAEQSRKEDARKFYVAISRAKKRLCISYTNFGVWSIPTRLTPFMNSIKHHFHFFVGRV